MAESYSDAYRRIQQKIADEQCVVLDGGVSTHCSFRLPPEVFNTALHRIRLALTMTYVREVESARLLPRSRLTAPQRSWLHIMLRDAMSSTASSGGNRFAGL